MSEFASTFNIQDEILDFLLSTPSPEQIIEFHASEEAQHRLRHLLDSNRNGTLTDSERAELDEAMHLNHLFIRLKAKAHLALKES